MFLSVSDLKMLQYGYWPGGEVETPGTANPLCAGSIPAPASNKTA